MRAYALAEAGVGVYALLVPLVLVGYPALQRRHVSAARRLARWPVAGALHRRRAAAARADDARWARPCRSCRATSSRPTTARSTIAGTVGRLYALNTFGAVVGTFFGGFVLLPGVGVRATNYVGRRHEPHARRRGPAVAPPPRAVPRRRRRRRTSRRSTPSTPPKSRAAANFAASVVCNAASRSSPSPSRAPSPWSIKCCGRARSPSSSAASVYSFTLILSRSSSGSPAAPRHLVAPDRAHAPPDRVARRRSTSLTAAMIGVSYIVMDKLPARFLAFYAAAPSPSTASSSVSSCLAALARLAGHLVHGRRLAADHPRRRRQLASRSAATSAPPTRSTRSAPSSARSPPASSCLPSLGLQRGSRRRAPSSTVLLAAALLFAARPSLKRLVAARVFPLVALCRSCTACRAGAWRTSRRACFASRSPRTSSRRKSGRCRSVLYYHDGIATTVSIEKLVADGRAQEQRQGRRLQRR